MPDLFVRPLNVKCDTRGIICGGPVTKQPGTREYRMVLRFAENGYCVCADYGAGSFGNGTYLDHWNYETPEAHFLAAMSQFLNVLEDQTQFYPSIFR